MTRKIIGLYQLITGIFGLILMLVSAYSKGLEVIKIQHVALQLIAGILLYALLAWSGYGLINNQKNAKRYSMFLQAVQIPFVAIAGIYYKFTAAGFILVGLRNGRFAFDLSFQPLDFSIHANGANESIYMICLIPILILYGLSQIK